MDLLVEQLVCWFSGFQELLTVEHTMFIIEMAADVPV